MLWYLCYETYVFFYFRKSIHRHSGDMAMGHAGARRATLIQISSFKSLSYVTFISTSFVLRSRRFNWLTAALPHLQFRYRLSYILQSFTIISLIICSVSISSLILMRPAHCPAAPARLKCNYFLSFDFAAATSPSPSAAARDPPGTHSYGVMLVV